MCINNGDEDQLKAAEPKHLPGPWAGAEPGIGRDRDGRGFTAHPQHEILSIQQLFSEVTIVYITVLSVAYLNATFHVFLIHPMLAPF